MSAVFVGAALALATILAAALYRKSRWIQALEAQLQAAAADLQHLQQACSHLAPPAVVQQLVVDRTQPDVAGTAERKIATALFVDLVGFTEMSERLEPAVLVRILNGYYERMTDAIDEHRGQVGTYIGDGIVAYFGALQSNPWQCDDAVRAAPRNARSDPRLQCRA
jgi:class 3 adenylate cyclase